MLALVDPYVESVARMRALERVLLRRAGLEQALGCRSSEELFSTPAFFPTGWAGARRESVRLARRENLLLLKTLAYGAPVVSVFRYPADVERLRAALKASLVGREEIREPPVSGGTLSRETIRQAVEGEPVEELPDVLVEALKRSRSVWKTAADLASIDRILDESLLLWQQEAARRWRCAFLVSYVALRVDLANLLAVARARAAGWPSERTADLFLRGGTIDGPSLTQLAGGTPENWKEHLADTAYEELIASLQSPEEIEFEAERIRIRYLRTTREALEGIEPLVAFYLARERDITTLASIGAGLDAGASADTLRKRAGPIWWEC